MACRSRTFPFSAIGRARIANEIEGFVKIVGDTKTDELLGCSHHRSEGHRADRRGDHGVAARIDR
jgi:pyruvate/2-oxoglutarate dehydrogenase complex dihydrolipoamide dehydrogenase (E3) component